VPRQLVLGDNSYLGGLHLSGIVISVLPAGIFDQLTSLR
jgi:hypothetical protein